MYRTGDKILYPMHGAGIIRQIKPCEILGQTKDYYLLKVPCGDMEVMIPVDNSDNIGVRPVGTKEDIDSAISVLGQDSTEMSGNWNKRYRENMEKIKTGNILLVAEIVRNLTRIDRTGKLSAGEKKMLSNARKILQSEIMLVLDITEEEALEKIEAAI
ncbi:MAG: CarD family transcriptional regulator [Clostridia bacterium]|nr:CarD family transcriptional regulator [Clostridia bacterium]